MKAKRLLAVILAALMTVSACLMSGCSGSNSDEDDSNVTSTRKIVTLNMYIIAEKETDKDAARQVQMEINRILLPEYKTMLKINYLTEDEYWGTIEKTQKQVEHYREYGLIPDDEEEAQSNVAQSEQTDVQNEQTEEATVQDGQTADGEQTAEGETEEEVLESDGAVKGTKDMSFNELIDFIFDADDITLSNPQLDIMIVNDYDKYCQMASDGELVAMDEYLNYDSSKLKKYIYPTILSSARVGKSTYGIPTNYGLESDFTYFVFNKDLLDKYGYSVSELTDYAGLSEYLELIKNNEPGVWPVSGTCGISGAEVYEDSFLAIGKQLNVLGNSILPTFMENKYTTYLKAVKEYGRRGYYPAEGTASENAKYAVEIVKTPELLEHEWNENGTNYAAYLYDVNRVSGEQAFKSAMCISSLSSNKDRAMEIITLFNTNEELANLLQYGIAGENYYYDADNRNVTMLNDSYSMNTMYTGNTYIKYPLVGEEDYVENAKKGNLNTAPGAFLGFYPKFDDPEELSVYECVKTICSAAQKAIEEDTMDIDTAITYVKRELVALGCVYVNTTDLDGIFGKLVAEQKALAALTSNSFVLPDEVVHYNDYYGIVLEEVEKPEPETEETAAETEDGDGTDAQAEEGTEASEEAEESVDA